MVCKGENYNVGKDNPFYGKKHTDEAIEKIKQSKLGVKNPNYNKNLSGENGPNWNSDYTKITYKQLHKWLRKQIPKPEKCEVCNIRPALDLANITGVYNRDLSNWQYQCRRCHMLIDGRLYNLKNTKVLKGATN